MFDRLRSHGLGAVSEADLRTVLNKLTEQLKVSDLAAIREALNRTTGKACRRPNAVRL